MATYWFDMIFATSLAPMGGRAEERMTAPSGLFAPKQGTAIVGPDKLLDMVTKAPADWGGARLATGMVDSPAIAAGGGSAPSSDAGWLRWGPIDRVTRYKVCHPGRLNNKEVY